MDGQHVEDDPFCTAFPEGMRELMMLYSELRAGGGCLVLATVRALAEHQPRR